MKTGGPSSRAVTFQIPTAECLFNPLNPELNPICSLLALLGAHHFLHVSRIRVKLLTLRLLMSYGRSPAEIVGSNPTGSMDICLL